MVQKIAQDLYGCKGWTAHTTSNPWGIRSRIRQYSLGTVPDRLFVDHFHVWTQYEYTQDKNFLKRNRLSFIKEQR